MCVGRQRCCGFASQIPCRFHAYADQVAGTFESFTACPCVCMGMQRASWNCGTGRHRIQFVSNELMITHRAHVPRMLYMRRTAAWAVRGSRAPCTCAVMCFREATMPAACRYQAPGPCGMCALLHVHHAVHCGTPQPRTNSPADKEEIR